MGIGKTEAALALAEILNSRVGCGGIFFGLPSQATANSIFNRVMDWGSKQSEDTAMSIRLAHGRAELNDDYKSLFKGKANLEEDGAAGSGLVAHSWFKGRKQALLADFVIGTIDQLLLAALKQKHLMLRHLGLSGKVIIIDECHAYDTYMSQYLYMAVRWLGYYRVPVIIMSATLPSSKRMDLVRAYLNDDSISSDKFHFEKGYPLLTWTDSKDINQKVVDWDFKRKSVGIEHISEMQISALLKDRLSGGGCAGIIVNTVKRAQNIAAALRNELKHVKIILLHSQYIDTDRASIEWEIVKLVGKSSVEKDRDFLVIVGTQVLEQSLDLDFDIMISDLCPMDLLIQRMGRLHRHERKRPKNLKNLCFIHCAGVIVQVFPRRVLWQFTASGYCCKPESFCRIRLHCPTI